jgi:hypothetical protein
MLYQRYEIEISESYLSKVFRKVGGQICLLGGWAVYLHVNRNFSSAYGRNYVGSRDIDLGFHVEKTWSDSILKESEFARVAKAMEAFGFEPLGFRYVQYFHIETHKPLKGEEVKTTPMHMMFALYIDLIVDNIHPRTKSIVGFDPIDEPVLSLVFNDKKFKATNVYGADVLLPHPEVLLATKLNSVVNRDKEHKRIKDIADIYALLWYSDINIKELKERLLSVYPSEKTAETVSSFTDSELSVVSQVLDIDKAEIKRVFAELL